MDLNDAILLVMLEGRDVVSFADALTSSGIQKQNRVILVMSNLPQWVIAFYGALLARAAVVFARSQTEPEDLVEMKDVAATVTADHPGVLVIPHNVCPTTDSLIVCCKRHLPSELVSPLVVFVGEFP